MTKWFIKVLLSALLYPLLFLSLSDNTFLEAIVINLAVSCNLHKLKFILF